MILLCTVIAHNSHFEIICTGHLTERWSHQFGEQSRSQALKVGLLSLTDSGRKTPVTFKGAFDYRLIYITEIKLIK